MASGDKHGFFGVNPGTLDFEAVLGYGLLFISVFFLVCITFPLLDRGNIPGGDNLAHTAEIYYLDRIFSENGSIFGWFHHTLTGCPLTYLYNPLLHILVLFAHKVFFIDLLQAEKITILLVICVYPVGLFYFLHKLGYSKLICGMAALFSLTSNAGWGNNITSDFWTGTITQAMGMLFFPIALALFYRSFVENKGITLLALVLVFSLFAHYLINYCLMIFLGVFFIVILASSRISRFGPLIGKYALVLIVLFCLTAFHVLPLVSLSRYFVVDVITRNGQFQGSQQDSLTLAGTVDHYLNGSLFDKSTPDLVDDRWYDNSKKLRPMFLTLFSCLGLAYCLYNLKSIGNAFLSIGFFASMLLFTGSDDFPLLALIPFSRNMWYVRAMASFEFFVVCLAGIGMYHSCMLISKAVMAGLRRYGHSVKSGLSCAILFSVICALVFGPLLIERSQVAGAIIGARHDSEDTELETIFPQLVSPAAGRMFAADEIGLPTSGWKLPEFSILSGLPVIIKIDWVQPYYATNMLKTLFTAKYSENGTNRGIAYKPQLMDLYNVRYLLAGRDWNISASHPAFRNQLQLLIKTKSFAFYGVQEEFTYFKFTPQSPVLVVASDDTWYDLESKWLKLYSDNKNFSRMPFLVRSKTQRLDDIKFDATKFPVTLLLDYSVKDPSAAQASLLEYKKGGGKAVSWDGGFPDVSGILRMNGTTRSSIRLPKTKQLEGNLSFSDPVSGLQKYSIDYSSDKPRFVVFKMSYFPGWSAALDGVPVETYEVSPSFVGLWVPGGSHTIEMKYHLDVGFMPYLLFAVGVALLYIFSIRNSRRMRPSSSDIIVRPKVYLVLIGILVLYMAYNYALQEYFGMPVLVSPEFANSYSMYRVPFSWNTPMSNSTNGTVYELQVSSCPVSFQKCVMFNTTLSERKYSLESDLLKQDKFYAWRVRSVKDGVSGAWNTGYFRTYKNTPPVTVYSP